MLTSNSFAGSPEIKPNPWMFYLGAFGGYYSADFNHGANYFSQTVGGGNNQAYQNDVFQHGFSGGGQFGINYHFMSPYFVGLVFNATINSNKARISNSVENAVGVNGRSTIFINAYRIKSNYDIAALFGIDVTPQTHVYAKLGATCGDLSNELTTTVGFIFPFPTPFLQQTQTKNIWGWVLGLGLIHDLNKWLSAFVEYDYYDYGGYDLNAIDNIPGAIPAGALRDRYSHNVRINASAFRLGLNLNFEKRYFGSRFINTANNFWMFYVGAFLGSYRADYSYGANYFSNAASGTNQVINFDTNQQGISGGGQVGVLYHFHNTYFLGFVFSGMMNANKARLSPAIDDAVGASGDTFDINNEFRINANYDMALTLGADITPRTHVYAKLGGAFASFTQHLFVTQSQSIPFPIPDFVQTSSRTIWAWLLGAGLTYDISKWVSTFIEYDYYDYGRYNLSILDRIAPRITVAQADRLTQNVDINASMFRIGLNINFGNRAVIHKLLTQPAWLVYLGAFGGYYSANFSYGANYYAITQIVGPGNGIFNSNVFQHGVSGGGQVGIQYHFRQPYFLGFVVSGALNANKGRLIEAIDGSQSPAFVNRAFNFNYRFLINNNIDLAGVFGLDITILTHLYAKLGASYGHLIYQLFTTQTDDFAFPSVFFTQTESQSLWGWIFGLGLSHDIGKCVNIFGEFDHYSYGSYELSTVNNIAAPAGGRTDHMTQHMRIHAFAVRVGLNVKFKL